RRLIFSGCLLGIILFVGCHSSNTVDKSCPMIGEFEVHKDSFIEEYWKLFPERASTQGYHKYDSVLIVPDQQSLQKQLAFAKDHLDALNEFDLHKLSDNNVTDYYILKHELMYMAWRITDEKSYQWCPSD